VTVVRLPWRLLGGVFALTLLSSCTGAGAGPERSDDGPLSVGEMVGGLAVDEPDVDPWSASFGTYFLCVEGGDTVHLEGVRAPGAPAPRRVRAVLHDEPNGAARSRDRFMSQIGTPPDWDEPYVDGRVRREPADSYTEDIQGEAVDADCPIIAETRDRFRELILILEAGSAGADVERFFIDYRVGEERYTLPVDWQIVMCGRQIREHCSRSRPQE
jgi:hypothetical protein